MDPSVVDPQLSRKLQRSAPGEQARPADVDAALGRASKQLQVWDIERTVLEPGRVIRERIDYPRLRSVAPRAGRPERAGASAEMARLVLASAAAHRAFRGFRALLRSAFAKAARGD